MNKVRIGLAGFGTVGSAVYRRLTQEVRLLEQRCGVQMEIGAIAVRNPKRVRKTSLPRTLLVRNAADLAVRKDLDLIVEVMGGCDVARKLVLASLKAGKPVVTANKALLAVHGEEVFGASDRAGVPIYFEASVAGGIPILRSLREGLVANRFTLIYGIVNGTCNYILSRMTQEGLGFQNALKQAQELGYAEVDPAFDIDGIDAAHKATVLASLAFGGSVHFRDVYVEGIRHVTSADVHFAKQLGYTIKLLAIIRPVDASHVEVRVHPTLIPLSNRLAAIRGVTNSIMVRGHVVGDIEFSGPGAGGDATASAVLGDLVEAATLLTCARNNGRSAIGRGLATLFSPSIRGKGPKVVPIGSIVCRYYVRLSVVDRPGVMFQISSILGKAKIGISSIFQPEGHEGDFVPLILMIHDATDKAMEQALLKIERLGCVKTKPVIFRVEDFST